MAYNALSIMDYGIPRQENTKYDKELLGWPFRVLKYICEPIYINADGIKVPKKEKDIMERWTSDFFRSFTAFYSKDKKLH